MQGPSLSCFLTPKVTCCFLLRWNNNPKGLSREEKTNIAQPWQYYVPFRRSFSSLIPQLVLSCSEGCPQQGFLGEQQVSSKVLTVEAPLFAWLLLMLSKISPSLPCWHFSHYWPKDHCISLPFIQFIVSAPPTFGSSLQKQKQPQSMHLWEGRILVFVHHSCLPSLKTLCLRDGFFCISVQQWVCCMDSAW